MAQSHRYRSIAELEAAYRSGAASVEAVTRAYLERIQATNAELNAITTINSKAINQAKQLDNLPEDRRGALHGVPILIKDNIITKDVETTFGSILCQNNVTAEDAAVVRKVKDAGAIILGKTTLPDWAQGYFSASSGSGVTKHPFDSSRDPGGSSSGNAAALARGLAVATIGTDTGGSVRLPSSFCGLVGIRPTPGRVSRSGISAIMEPWDTAGPMTTTVADAARIMDVLAGFDETDDYTSVNYPTDGFNFSHAVINPSISGKRLGVLRQIFGSHKGILDSTNEAITKLGASGAILTDVEIPDLDEFMTYGGALCMRSKADMNKFFLSQQSLAHLKIEDIHAAGDFHDRLDFIHATVQAPQDFHEHPAFCQALLGLDRLRRQVRALFAKNNLDAIIYPTCQLLAPKTRDVLEKRWSDLSYPTNTRLASLLLGTAISIPIGKAQDDEYPDDPALPVGLEILGLSLAEAKILEIAAALESMYPRFK